MNAEYYFIHEVRNVLFAHLVSPRLAASQFGRPGSIALSSPEDLQDLAACRNKLLRLPSLPLGGRPAHKTEPIPV